MFQCNGFEARLHDSDEVLELVAACGVTLPDDIRTRLMADDPPDGPEGVRFVGSPTFPGRYGVQLSFWAQPDEAQGFLVKVFYGEHRPVSVLQLLLHIMEDGTSYLLDFDVELSGSMDAAFDLKQWNPHTMPLRSAILLLVACMKGNS